MIFVIQKPHGRMRRYAPDAVTYTVCNHQQKYFFKQNSLLKNYLEEQCNGFVEDSSYTLNYIIVVLLANWKELGLLYHCSVRCTGRLRKIFKVHYKYLHFSALRSLVRKHFRQPLQDREYERKYFCHSMGLLWCVSPEILELVAPPLSKTECVLRPLCGAFGQYNFCFRMAGNGIFQII